MKGMIGGGRGTESTRLRLSKQCLKRVCRLRLEIYDSEDTANHGKERPKFTKTERKKVQRKKN